MADTKKVCLEDIEKIDQDSVEGKEEEVPAEAATSFLIPTSVGSDDGASGFGQKGSCDGGQKGGEEQPA